MSLKRCFRLYSACYRLNGFHGLISCTKYLCGALKLDQIPEKSSELAGASYD